MQTIINKSVPADEKERNFIYEMLFCDELSFYAETLDDISTYPWQVLFSNAPSSSELYEMIDRSTGNTRLQLLAYNKLKQANHPILKKELLAVIVEVGLTDGLDTLASYRDGSARYINHSGKILIWDVTTSQSLQLTAKLFEAAEKLLTQIGPWEYGRLNRPKTGNARISLLATNGIYFGEADCDVLFSDELAAPSLTAATALLSYLTSKVTDRAG